MDFNYLLNQKNNYYKNTAVLFALVKQLRKRELALLPVRELNSGFVVRYLKAFCIKFLNNIFSIYNFENNFFRLYKSLCEWDFLPTLPYRTLEKRKSEAKKYFDLINSSAVSYDFVVDIDSKSFSKAKKNALKVWDFLSENKINFYAQFSGKKGFHFFLPYNYLVFNYPNLNFLLKNNISELLNKYIFLGEFVQNKTDVEIDKSVYTLPTSCLIKLTYSIDYIKKYDKLSVVQPILSYEELKKSKIKDFFLENFNFNKIKKFDFNVELNKNILLKDVLGV